MDLSDDIAYSVHDFEDAIVNGYLDPARLAAGSEHTALLDAIQTWVGFDFARDELEDALYRLMRLPEWIGSFDGGIPRAGISGPRVIEAEMAVLKGIIGAVVVSIEGRKTVYKEQRRVLKRLATALWEQPDALDAMYTSDFATSESDAARRRVIVDQVASLTDQHAIAWHGRLVGEVDAASLGVWAPGSSHPTRTAETAH